MAFDHNPMVFVHNLTLSCISVLFFFFLLCQIIHGSDGPEGAAHEIAFWFKEGEIFDYSPPNNVWVYEKP